MSSMSYPPASTGTTATRRSAFHIDYGASRRRLAMQPEALARGVITQGSAQLRTLGRSIRTGAAMAAVFQEDLKNTSRKIFDPQDRMLVRLNRSFLISCILSIAIDPLFFYTPRITDSMHGINICIGIDRELAVFTAVFRSVVDLFFVARIVLQFRTAFIAPSSRVFGRGELVIDTMEIAKRYFRRFFIADVLSIVPLPQLVVWLFTKRVRGTAVLATKDNLVLVILLQYVPRLARIYPLSTELKRTSGVFAETALAGAAYYLLWYMLASHVRMHLGSRDSSITLVTKTEFHITTSTIQADRYIDDVDADRGCILVHAVDRAAERLLEERVRRVPGVQQDLHVLRQESGGEGRPWVPRVDHHHQAGDQRDLRAPEGRRDALQLRDLFLRRPVQRHRLSRRHLQDTLLPLVGARQPEVRTVV